MLNPNPKIVIIIALGLLLTACGGDGPLGNTPGPSKPEQSFQHF